MFKIMSFKGKKILITGGTGSLGQALTDRLLKSGVDTVRIFSRNENKQTEMESKFNDDRLRFFIGDVRDLPRLTKAVEDTDIVFHAAALKHVPVVEYNPFESIKTNVMGSQNVIDACLHENVGTAVGIGTDKAVSPLNIYGATKLIMEKLFTSANNYLDKSRYKTKFIALRYGNVLGSSGSVAPKFIKQIQMKQKITITDNEMTRFSLTMNEALDFILEATNIGKGSEVFVPKLKAYSIGNLKESIIELLENTGEEKISVRAGEKMHEVMINSDEIQHTWEIGNKYVIFNPLKDSNEIMRDYSKIKKAQFSNGYSSDLANMLTKDELKKIIIKAGLLDVVNFKK
jgi:UDP-N-acetylglucosamine 4,6-dehydratase